MIPKTLKAFAKRTGIYSIFYRPSIFPLYLQLRNRKAFEAWQAELNFYRTIFGDSKLGVIFDIGANAGSKTLKFLRLANRVVCAEPDGTSCARLREKFMFQRRVYIVAKGVGSHCRIEEFGICEEGSGLNTFSRKWQSVLSNPEKSRFDWAVSYARFEKVDLTTLDKLIEEHGLPDFVKIDVEGYESEVLQGLSEPVPLLSFECNLPEFEAETSECIRRLVKIDPKALFNCTISEPPLFLVSPSWVNADEMFKLVFSRRYRFMEILCKSCKPFSFARGDVQ